MKNKFSVVSYSLVILFLFVLWGCGLWKSLGNDNVLEELAEEIIKDSTGIDIDFTGDSPEKD